MAEPKKKQEDTTPEANAGQESMLNANDEPKGLVATSDNDKISQLTPVQKINTQIIKYATQLWNKERATEFATRVALIARDNKQLAEAIEKNPDSFLSAYMASVSLNLMPNTPEGDAYIIPYGTQVQFQTGYKGLIKLARRSGQIKTISAELVFKGDTFDVGYGTDRHIIHKPNLDVDRTNYAGVEAAYATAQLTNGETQFAVMTKKELKKIQDSAKAKSTDAPWHTWPERMALKTVLKRLMPMLPQDDVMAKAVAMDSLAEAGKLNLDKNGEVIEGEVVNLPKSVTDAIDAAQESEDLQAVLNDLSPAEKKLAQPLIDKKIEEL